MELMFAAAAVGVLVGVLSGLLGIGGGTVMVPVFRLVFGMSPIEATATSLFAIIPTSISGMVTHLRNRTCVLKLGLAAGLAGAVMSPVGVVLASISPDWLIMVAAACVILYSSASMLRKALATGGAKGGSKHEPAKGSAPAKGVAPAKDAGEPGACGAKASVADGSAAAGEVPDLPARKLVIGAAIGLVAGLLGGYVGVGGGFIMVPLFISVLGVSMRLASGTSLIAVMLIAIPGAIEQAVFGNVQFVAGLALAVGSIPGALLGANLVKYVPERLLRFLFAGFLAVAAVMLVLNEIGFPG